MKDNYILDCHWNNHYKEAILALFAYITAFKIDWIVIELIKSVNAKEITLRIHC